MSERDAGAQPDPSAVAEQAIRAAAGRGPAAPPAAGVVTRRARTLLEVLWLALGAGLMTEALFLGLPGFGVPVGELGAWRLGVMVGVQNLLAVTGVFVFLRLDGRDLGDLGFRRRRLGGEAAIGLVVFPVLVGAAWGSLLLLHRLAPWLQTRPDNPLLGMIRGPGDLAIFLVISVLAGGVGEETVRAFVLRRFADHLGGLGVGLVAWSAVFGALHLAQGADRALAVGLVGLLLGCLYAWRGSPVAPMVAHAAFDVLHSVAAYLASSG